MTTPYDGWPDDVPKPVPWPEVTALFPSHTPEEIAALEATIKKYGVLIPPVLMPDGRMIDGYRRWQLAAKLGKPLPPPNVMPADTTDEQGLLLALELQIGRRNEEPEEDQPQGPTAEGDADDDGA